MADSDAVLVTAARGGDERAFDELIARRNLDLRVFVAAHARDRDQLEEVCQATWVAAWQGLRGFSGAAPFDAWLRGIARNQLKRELTRRAQARARGGLAELAEAVVEATVADLDRGDEDAERRAARMPGCLERLAPRARALLLARDRDGVSLADLARRFKQPMGALATALWRVRASMRSCLDQAP
jgi:RNA polymerase sigma-70 factor (ECF subfamily)